MSNADIFKILQTTSSEVSRPNLFYSSNTTYIPDLFVIIFSVTLLGVAVCLDLLLIFFFAFNCELFVTLVFASTFIPHSICEFLFDKKKAYKYVYNYIPSQMFYIVIYILGFGSIITCSRILMETFTIVETKTRPVFLFPYPFFHTTNENLSTLKIFCSIHLVLKSIPQLFIVPVFLLERYVTGILAIILQINILLNVLIFCQVIATTFPIRKSPRVFTSTTCILLNASDKFMGTMCACCIHLLIFAVLFKGCKYYAILLTLFRSLFWIIPCWRILKALTVPITNTCFAVYFIFISLVFGFIYVHPFEGLGKLYYYLFYLLGFLYETFIIYLVADANVENISYYVTLKILMFGFLSCFGLLNIFHKYRETKFGLCTSEKSVEVMNTEYMDVESMDEETAESGRNVRKPKYKGKILKISVPSKSTPESGRNVRNPKNKGKSPKISDPSKSISEKPKNPKGNVKTNEIAEQTESAESTEVIQEERQVSKDKHKSRGFVWRWR